MIFDRRDVTMTTSPPLRVKVCQFDSNFGLTQYYVCFRNETCCRDGCCTPRNVRYLNSWYFWLGILVAFAVYRVICWYCKKVEHDCQMHHQQLTRPRDVRNLLRENGVDDAILNQLEIVTIATTPSSGNCHVKTDAPPPDYTEALTLPKPLRCHRNTPTTTQPQSLPTYEEATSVI